jgi:chemotaxis family two-component system sensor kinase Cph1
MKKSPSADQTKPLSAVPEPSPTITTSSTSQHDSGPFRKAESQDHRSLPKGLQEKEERFNNILNHVAVGIAQVNLQRKYIFANSYFCKLVGRTPEQLYQLRIDDITHPDDVNHTRQLFDELIHHNATHVDVEKRYVRLDGSVVWVLVTDACVRSETGRPEYVLKVVQDITARHNAEEALRRANDDLRQFAFAASHDLQEPLRMISNYTQLLLRKFRGQMDEDASLYAQYIRQGTERMANLLDDLLAYTSLGATVGNTSGSVNLQETLERVLEDLRSEISVNAAQITYDPLPTVRGHESHFVQLFRNLIGNALKYRSQQAPSIHISVTRQSNCFLFAVRDNGIGIDPAYHTSIFGVFKRLHTSDIPGTGIGLAICQRVVERYGGKIWVESQPDKGATFYFTLPAPVS